MGEPKLTATRLAGSSQSGALLVVGPSLGTSVEALWESAARLLGSRFEVVGWDLPGHGRSPSAVEPFDVAGLASAVRRIAAGAAVGRPAAYAGVSLGGAVALELATDPGVFRAVACLASAARLGDPASWHERAELVRRAGTPVMVASSSTRWFPPGFLERQPSTANRLLLSLSDADKESYALCCEALAGFDIRGRLGQALLPVLVGPGELDVVVPPGDVEESTTRLLPRATTHVFAGCGHLPPAEDPVAVTEALLTAFASVSTPGGNR